MPATATYLSSSPVFSVAGSHTGELGRDCLRVDVHDDVDGLRNFSGWFSAIGPTGDGSSEQLQYLDGTTVDFGDELAVTLGPPAGERRVFTGTVSALEVQFVEGDVPTVVVFAEDALMALRATRRCATYTNQSDADIARRIADEHGMAADVDAPGPTHDVVHQWNQSDLAFLRERAQRIGAEIWVEDRTLHFVERQRRSGAEVTLVQGNHLLELRARADLAHQRTSVTVSGYDASARGRIDETAESGDLDAEVTGGRTGISVLRTAVGDRPTFRVQDAPLVAEEARSWAKAELLRRGRSFVTAEGLTSGTPDLVAGSRVTLERCGPPFDGSGWYVTWTHHSWDRSDGHRTRFRAERATVGT